MAHYAFLNDNNMVVEVITGKEEDEILDGLTPEEWYGNFRGLRCIRTSYSGSIRKNFAGIGYTYDEELDAFIPPKPYVSWTLDTQTCRWVAPEEYPNDGGFYTWNENRKLWEPVSEV